jgi:hypothetical protein
VKPRVRILLSLLQQFQPHPRRKPHPNSLLTNQVRHQVSFQQAARALAPRFYPLAYPHSSQARPLQNCLAQRPRSSLPRFTNDFLSVRLVVLTQLTTIEGFWVQFLQKSIKKIYICVNSLTVIRENLYNNNNNNSNNNE